MSRNYVTSYRGETYYTPNGKLLNIKDEPVTPIEEDFGEHNHLDDSINNDYGGMRKSLSMNDLASLRQSFAEMEMHDYYNRHHRVPATGELSKTKFVSLAESIYHYQRDTPTRFHSRPPQAFKSQAFTGPTGLTIPQSPMLRCKGRSRPHHILSQKEKEQMEAEEIKKHKIKANPIPKSVIEGCKNLPDVARKLPTVPEPFNLTEVHKKHVLSPMHVQAFKARPAPKHILEKPQICIKHPVHVTKPITPKFHYKPLHPVNIENKPKENKQQKPAEKPVRHGPILPEPFSFEKRDEEMKRRREERIKKQLEEEKKQASLFKAQPLPGGVRRRMLSASGKCSSSTTSSDNKENCKFEAKPPVVLYKEPFKPVLKPVQLIKPAPFELTTVKRAAERERFDKILKEKEIEQERFRQQKEQEMLKAEEEAKAKLRAKLVHHAKPVRVVSPFVPEKSEAPLTVPETPKFIRRLRH